MWDCEHIYNLLDRLLILRFVDETGQSSEEEIITNFVGRQDTNYILSQNAIYSYLDDFCRDGFLICKSVRKKTTYSFTDKGQRLLIKLQREWADFLFSVSALWHVGNQRSLELEVPNTKNSNYQATLMVLLHLKIKEQCSHDLLKAVQKNIHFSYDFNRSNLNSILKNLIDENCLWTFIFSRGQRNETFYRLNPKGERLLNKLITQWKNDSQIINRIIAY